MKNQYFSMGMMLLILLATACTSTYKIPKATSTEYGEFPVPGRLVGTTSFSHADSLPEMCNSNYPKWYRGKAPNGLADENSMHWYKILMGPGAKTGFDPKNIMCGIFELKPGITYPAHNHPSREFYYVISGEAEWWADDEMKNVTAGASMYHQPFTVHGFTNTSKTEPLRLFWIWWVEDEDHPDVLNIGGKFTDPDLTKTQKTVKAHAVPIPEVRKKKKK